MNSSVTRLVWTDDLNTGIDVIDGQHRRIVDYINQIHEARLRRDSRLVAEVIEAAVDYTLSHFGFEEALMEEVGYPFARAHTKVHQLFTRRVADLQLRFRAGEDVAEELHSLLAKWLFTHIRNDDADYVSAVKSRIQHGNEARHRGWAARTLGRFFRRE
ncbi:MAG: bacteriohemerythrin [Pseudomonadota bacterium]|jgi:hemerythrin-like metal-binding domain|nr:MAG: bacteriohemerythrin [Pseudomonadota bacterium]